MFCTLKLITIFVMNEIDWKIVIKYVKTNDQAFAVSIRIVVVRYEKLI